MGKQTSIFPFMTTTKIPDNIEVCLSDYAFRELTDSLHESKGFDFLLPGARYVHSNNRWLFKYVENKRKPNKQAVERLHRQWLQKATDEGRKITSEMIEDMRERAISEVQKFASISEMIVHLIFDENAGRIWCLGSSSAKCLKAMNHLRKALGSLVTTPIIFDLASRQIARQLGKGMSYKEGFPDNLLIPENGNIDASDGDQRVRFDGVDLRDTAVSEVLREMNVRALEMYLVRPEPKGPPTVVATFVLHIPESGPIHIKSLDYEGADALQAEDAAHDYATEMLILSGFAWEIFDALRSYFHGTTGISREAWTG